MFGMAPAYRVRGGMPGFVLSQEQIDADVARRRESRLAKLPPIFRFLRATPMSPTVDEGEAPDWRAEPTVFRTKPLTRTSQEMELQLSAIEAGEAGASVVGRAPVPPAPPPGASGWRQRVLRSVWLVGGVTLVGLFLW